VQQLGDGERAVRVDSADDRLPGLRLRFVGHAGLMDVALRERPIGVDAFGDDRSEAAPPETLVIAGHCLGRPAVLGRTYARHRRDGQAVLRRVAVYNDWREKRACVDVHRPDLQRR
jgi:hypothetical protein